MDELQFKALLEKYASGKCTPDEIILLESWYLSKAKQDQPAITEQDDLLNYQNFIWEDIRQRTGITQKLPGQKTVRLWPRIAAAASVLLCLSVGGYFLLHKKPIQQFTQNQTHDIAPGTAKAILKISGGKTVILDNASKGLISQQGNTLIDKTSDGQVAYSATNTGSTNQAAFDTVQIPAGGKIFKLKLSDGTKLVLNAATTIRYPESFHGNKREVELISGEALFEVVHNAKMPFKVITNYQVIEDIGTRFNVNAYPDEPHTRITLVQGAIKISSGSSSKLIQPGQVAYLENGLYKVSHADIEETLAWQNGYFRFNNEKIESIMRKLAKWYNIEVVYVGKVSEEGYYAKISRSKGISEVLKVLEKAKGGAHFKIEGRRVTVMP